MFCLVKSARDVLGEDYVYVSIMTMMKVLYTHDNHQCEHHQSDQSVWGVRCKYIWVSPIWWKSDNTEKMTPSPPRPPHTDTHTHARVCARVHKYTYLIKSAHDVQESDSLLRCISCKDSLIHRSYVRWFIATFVGLFCIREQTIDQVFKSLPIPHQMRAFPLDCIRLYQDMKISDHLYWNHFTLHQCHITIDDDHQRFNERRCQIENGALNLSWYII